MIAVMARNHREFHEWLHDLDRNNELGKNPKFIRYISKPEDVIGTKVHGLIKIGTWYENKDAAELEEIIRTYMR